jgi:hypothetical protein
MTGLAVPESVTLAALAASVEGEPGQYADATRSWRTQRARAGGNGLLSCPQASPRHSVGRSAPVYLASSPQVAGVTGGYFVNRKRAEPSALAKDAQAAARLWALSEDLAGLAPTPG